MAPSPTAEATRLTDSARTSPATKTPGTEHSRWYGARDSGQSAGGRPASSSSAGPVCRKPRESRAKASPSHSVGGWAPMKTNSRDAGTVWVCPVAALASTSRSTWSVPSTATTWVQVSTSMAELASIRATR